MARAVQQTSILLVEPDPTFRHLLIASAGTAVRVESHARYETARPRLEAAAFDLLVANIRLGAYNGLHLVYIARLAGTSIRAVVYEDTYNYGLAREAQLACAFYELRERLPVVLPAYLGVPLPDMDRRNPALFDRRRLARGGRRRWDQHVGGFPAGPS